MSFQPQYETYRYTNELTTLYSQSLVECRLPGSEIGSILAVNAQAVCTECLCADGEVRYGGKLRLCILYEDGNRKICRAERGAEFYHKAEGGCVSPACFAKTRFHVENVTHRREGSGLYLSVVVGAVTRVFGGKSMEYLNGGEDVVVKKERVTLYKTVCVSGETEGEDEFETEHVGDILLHDETALVRSCKVSVGQIDVEGEIQLSVCVLKSDESVCAYERLIPFSLQIPSEEAFGQARCAAQVTVKEASLTAAADDDSGKCKIVFAYALAVDCDLSSKEELDVAADAFSTTCETELKYQKEQGRYLTKQIKCVERVAGTAALSPTVDGEYALLSVVMPRATATCKRQDGGWEAEGVVTAEVLLKNTEGAYKATTLQLPFAFPVAVDGENVEALCAVCGLNVRRSLDGETQAEAVVKISLTGWEEKQTEYVAELTEGEKIQPSRAAISLFIPCVGDDLWAVAKRRRLSPEDVQKANPDLKFPVKEGERILVYRQIP